MKKRKTKKQAIQNALPAEKLPWSQLSDMQKGQQMMDSPRLLDSIEFIRTFISWEQPDNTNPTNI